MEVVIGFKDSARDVTFETDLTADVIRERVNVAIESEGILHLEAKKNREFSIAAKAIAFVEIREADTRRVGFGL
ncbi:DUF3107 domain-containing protein [Actinotignum urinale]|uniref:DUF3107 domain-containing protein n=1 Tax=Actinotignum urinale TaxID=190146 RepID=UPI00370D9B00